MQSHKKYIYSYFTSQNHRSVISFKLVTMDTIVYKSVKLYKYQNFIIKLVQMQNHNNPIKTNYNDYQFSNTNIRAHPSNIESSSRKHIQSLQFANQPPKNNQDFGLFSKRYIAKETSFNRSRVSAHNVSHNGSAYIGQEKLYSEQMLFLLSQEEKNIQYFKQKIEGEKSRVHRDFDNFKQSINHVIQDLRISFIAQLDVVYKEFINKYKKFKEYMISLKQIRRSLSSQIPLQNVVNSPSSRVNLISNRDLLQQIQKDTQLFRAQKFYSQITDLQKQKIVPARQITAQIILLGGLEATYYNEQASTEFFKKIFQEFHNELNLAYEDINGLYIKTPDNLIRENMENRSESNILNGIAQSQNSFHYERAQFKSLDPKDLMKNNQNHQININYAQKRNDRNERNEFAEADYGINNEVHVQKQQRKMNRPASSSTEHFGYGMKHKNRDERRDKDRDERNRQEFNQNERHRPTSDWKSSSTKHHTNGNGFNTNLNPHKQKRISPKTFRISLEQQNISNDWIQDLSFKEIGAIDAYQSTDAILCGVFANQGKHLAIGGKDRMVRVFQVMSGKLLFTLPGHNASICSMANHGSFISSGGDDGCSSLILWDCKTWTIKSRFQGHFAAITSIVDLKDGRHLVTGGFDSKINIYNYKKGNLWLTCSSNKSKITCMVLSADKLKLVTTGLDFSIFVWKLTYDRDSLSSMEIQKQIPNNSLICSLKASSIKSSLFVAGTKEGKLLLINMMTGQVLKRLAAGNGSIIELVLFQRQNKSDMPLIISCAPKQKSLILTKTETGVNSLIDVKGRLNVEYGCGIGPKIVINDQGIMAILSQSPHSKQILLYQVNIL